MAAGSLTERLRRRYSPQRRWRLLRFATTITVLAYIARAIQQLVLAPLPDQSRVIVVDFAQYLRAAADLNAGRDPYQFFLQHCGQSFCPGGYIYPPLLAEIMRPLALLDSTSAARVWLLACHLALLATVLLVHRTIAPAVSRTVEALLLIATMVFLPVYQNLFSLQVGMLLTLLLAVTGYAVVRNREGWGGVTLATAVVTRLTPLVVAPIFFTRTPKGRAGGPAALVLVAGGLLLGLQLLSATTWEYFTRVLPILGSGTPFLENQSLSAVAERASTLTVGQVTGTASAIALAISAALVIVTWMRSLGLSNPRARGVVFASFVALMPIVSSLTWQHHLVPEMLVIAFLTPALVLPRHRRALRLTLAAYPLLWVDRHVTDPLANVLGLSSPRGFLVAPFLLVTGLNLVGMFLLWLACIDCLGLERRAEAGV